MCLRPTKERHEMSDYVKRQPDPFPADLLRRPIPRGLLNRDGIAATLETAALRAENGQLRSLVEILLVQQNVGGDDVLTTLRDRLSALRGLLTQSDGRAAMAEVLAMMDEIDAYVALRAVTA